jgi:hypothetical protein
MREDTHRFVWTLSDRAALWYDDQALEGYLRRDFERHLLYSAEKNGDVTCLLGATNLNETGDTARLFVWVSRSARNGPYLMHYWIEFLHEMRSIGLALLTADIKLKNELSLRVARHVGFVTNTPDASTALPGVRRLCRTTDDGRLELRYLKRRHHSSSRLSG